MPACKGCKAGRVPPACLQGLQGGAEFRLPVGLQGGKNCKAGQKARRVLTFPGECRHRLRFGAGIRLAPAPLFGTGVLPAPTPRPTSTLFRHRRSSCAGTDVRPMSVSLRHQFSSNAGQSLFRSALLCSAPFRSAPFCPAPICFVSFYPRCFAGFLGAAPHGFVGEMLHVKHLGFILAIVLRRGTLRSRRSPLIF